MGIPPGSLDSNMLLLAIVVPKRASIYLFLQYIIHSACDITSKTIQYSWGMLSFVQLPLIVPVTLKLFYLCALNGKKDQLELFRSS